MFFYRDTTYPYSGKSPIVIFRGIGKMAVMASGESQRTTRMMVVRSLISHGWAQATASPDPFDSAIRWTAKGEQRLVLLRNMIDFEVLSAEEVLQYTLECKRRVNQKVSGTGDATEKFWLACLDELQIGDDPHFSIALAELMKNSSSCALEIKDSGSLRVTQRSDGNGEQ